MFNAQHTDDHGPVDHECSCAACSGFSRAYLRHLFKARELLAYQLATIHNLFFYQWLMREARAAVVEGRYMSWKKAMIGRMAGLEAMRTTH
jgi:queuine tRNA-ribosyltransferase